MLLAGSMWAEHQEKNETPVSIFDDLASVVNLFSHIPHGICSQNSQKNIYNVLREHQIDKPFKSVIGYSDVDSEQQKPHPYGGIKCIESILGNLENLFLMYIGDHEADVQFARNLESSLGADCRVIAVAASYSGSAPASWNNKPDYIACSVNDLTQIIGKYA